MIRTLIFLTILTLCAALSPNGSVSVRVSALKSSKGSVLIYLYRNEAGFPTEPKKAWKTASSSIVGTQCEYTFENIPFGTYAVTVVHDENASGALDTNFIGIPKEGTGTSNNAKGSFGPPKFADAKFDHQQSQTILDIKTSY